MSVTLPEDLQAWAEAEVVASRAQSVEQIVASATADYRRRLEALRRSLKEAEAEADEKGRFDAEDLLDELDATLEPRPLDTPEIREMIATAVEDVREGRVYPADKIFAELRARYQDEE